MSINTFVSGAFCVHPFGKIRKLTFVNVNFTRNEQKCNSEWWMKIVTTHSEGATIWTWKLLNLGRSCLLFPFFSSLIFLVKISQKTSFFRRNLINEILIAPQNLRIARVLRGNAVMREHLEVVRLEVIKTMDHNKIWFSHHAGFKVWKGKKSEKRRKIRKFT